MEHLCKLLTINVLKSKDLWNIDSSRLEDARRLRAKHRSGAAGWSGEKEGLFTSYSQSGVVLPAVRREINFG
jgi:hypothetical protein